MHGDAGRDAVSPPASEVVGPTSLLERDRELAALTHGLAGARSGRGAVLLIEGPPGIGKSRLLAAAGQQAEEEGMTVLRTRGIELEREVPSGVSTQLFVALLGAAGAHEREHLLAGHAGLAAPLFDPAAPASGDPLALVRGLYWLTVNLATGTGAHARARHRPLVVAVDDAQWSDRPSLMFLAHLAARIDDLPLALMLAVRTGEPGPADNLIGAVRQLPGCTMLTPAPLTEAAVGSLVEAELPGAEQAFVAACAHVSGGNPFIATELARTLRADGCEPTAEAAGRVQQLVPATVLHSLLMRLGRLGESAQQIAAAVAVLGDGTPLRRAIALSAAEPDDAENAADALAEAGILAPEEPLRFAHPLIATAVYSDLPVFARARAHRTAAELLGGEGASVQEIAAHLRLSRPESDPATVGLLREAAHRALAQGDPEAAARLLDRTLAEPPPADQRADVLLELAEAEAMAGSPAAEQHVAQALEQLTDPVSRVPALRAMSRIRIVVGDQQAAADALLEGLDAVGPGDAAAQQILAEYLTISRFRAPLHPDVRRRLALMLAGARRGAPPTDPGLLAHVLLDLALHGEPAATVRELAERATADDPLIDVASHGMPMGIVVQALCCVDELAAAERIAAAALTEARRRGSIFAAAVASYHVAIPRYHGGALSDAIADLDQALAPSREGWSNGVVWTQALLVHALLERGELPAAAEIAAQFSAREQSMEAAIGLFARGRLALVRRDPAAALIDARAAGSLLSDGFGIDHPGFVPWRQVASAAAAVLGEPQRARKLAEEQLELARTFGVPRALALSLRTVAAAVADGSRRIELLSDAMDSLEHSPSLLERAHVMVNLGSALRRAGRRSDAQGPLRAALQLADRIGAVPLADAARGELRASGARPRRAAVTGADALTPAELRVVQLAAQELTNAQIAQDLFVTTKTVQTHLAHAYRKLEISSRRELVDVLGERQQTG